LTDSIIISSFPELDPENPFALMPEPDPVPSEEVKVDSAIKNQIDQFPSLREFLLGKLSLNPPEKTQQKLARNSNLLSPVSETSENFDSKFFTNEKDFLVVDDTVDGKSFLRFCKFFIFFFEGN
jgi:hypothetical protein